MSLSIIIPWTDRPWLAPLLEAFVRQCAGLDIEVLLLSPQTVDGATWVPFSGNDVGAMRKYGASVASGDYIAFIDSDDWHSPHWLKHTAEIGADRSADIVFAGMGLQVDVRADLWRVLHFTIPG